MRRDLHIVARKKDCVDLASMKVLLIMMVAVCGQDADAATKVNPVSAAARDEYLNHARTLADALNAAQQQIRDGSREVLGNQLRWGMDTINKFDQWEGDMASKLERLEGASRRINKGTLKDYSLMWKTGPKLNATIRDIFANDVMQEAVGMANIRGRLNRTYSSAKEAKNAIDEGLTFLDEDFQKMMKADTDNMNKNIDRDWRKFEKDMEAAWREQERARKAYAETIKTAAGEVSGLMENDLQGLETVVANASYTQKKQAGYGLKNIKRLLATVRNYRTAQISGVESVLNTQKTELKGLIGEYEEKLKELAPVMSTTITQGWQAGITRMHTYFDKVKEKHKEIVKAMKDTTKEVEKFKKEADKVTAKWPQEVEQVRESFATVLPQARTKLAQTEKKTLADADKKFKDQKAKWLEVRTEALTKEPALITETRNAIAEQTDIADKMVAGVTESRERVETEALENQAKLLAGTSLQTLFTNALDKRS